MARQCNKCANYEAEYDAFRQKYVDVLKESTKERQQHFCPMYDGHIPEEIYYDGKKCPYFGKDL